MGASRCTWTGISCKDKDVHVMHVGIVFDYAVYAACLRQESDYHTGVALTFAETSFLYENQFNIKLQIAYWISYIKNDASVPSFARGVTDEVHDDSYSCDEGLTLREKLL